MNEEIRENLVKLIDNLNLNTGALTKPAKALANSPECKINNVGELSYFKLTLFLTIFSKDAQTHFRVENSFRDVNELVKIDINKLKEDCDDQALSAQLNELANLLVIPEDGMKAIINNFVEHCNFKQIKLMLYEGWKDLSTEQRLALNPNNDFIQICNFIYQMLYHEKKSSFLNNTPYLGNVLKKYKNFFKAISQIENIKDYFANLDKIECNDPTFNKLIKDFGEAKDIGAQIINSDVFSGKAETEMASNNKFTNNDNNKIKVQWLKIRAIMEEACEVVFFFGGLVLTALIALGILPWGALGIGICATLAFIGITRFIATNSWTADHNLGYEWKKYFPDRKEYSGSYLLVFRIFVIPGISLIAGAIFVALGVTGVWSLSLGLGLGIPLLGSSLIGGINMIFALVNPEKYKEKVASTDNLWGVYMGISAVIATATFLGLGFGEILALPIAITLATSLFILGVTIGLLTLFAYGVSKHGSIKLKGWLKNQESEISCLGFGYFKEPSYSPTLINEKEEK